MHEVEPFAVGGWASRDVVLGDREVRPCTSFEPACVDISREHMAARADSLGKPGRDRVATGSDLPAAPALRIGAAIHAHGFAGVSLAHKPIFLNLSQPRRIGELAELVGVTKNAIVYLVNQLEQGGYVTRLADSTDGRATVVTLTGTGAEVVQVVADALRAMADEWRSVLGDKE